MNTGDIVLVGQLFGMCVGGDTAYVKILDSNNEVHDVLRTVNFETIVTAQTLLEQMSVKIKEALAKETV